MAFIARQDAFITIVGILKGTIIEDSLEVIIVDTLKDIIIMDIAIEGTAKDSLEDIMVLEKLVEKKRSKITHCIMELECFFIKIII